MKISTILDHIDIGHIALPEFQRGYVWNRNQVRELLTPCTVVIPWAACWFGKRNLAVPSTVARGNWLPGL